MLFHVVFMLSIGLLVIDLVLLYTVVYLCGKEYSFFYPWRKLLQLLMLYTVYMIAADVWWYSEGFGRDHAFFAYRWIISRFLFSLVICSFSFTWTRSIERVTDDSHG